MDMLFTNLKTFTYIICTHAEIPKAEYFFHIVLFSKTTRDFNLEDKALKIKTKQNKQTKTKAKQKNTPQNDTITASLKEWRSRRIIKSSRFCSVVTSSWVCFLLQYHRTDINTLVFTSWCC